MLPPLTCCVEDDSGYCPLGRIISPHHARRKSMNKKVVIVKVAYANDKGTRVWIRFEKRIRGETKDRFTQLWVPVEKRTREDLEALVEAKTEVYVEADTPAVDEINSRFGPDAYCFEMIG
jgi:hypothetical protein